jgi:hypothetical protein
MQGASSVRAVVVPSLRAATDGRSGWAARRVIRRNAYAHTTSSSLAWLVFTAGRNGSRA